MAENKNSFTAYCDWGSVFDELTDEQAGKLIKHLFDYVRDKNPTPPDPTTKLLFIQIKATLKRDLKKWEAKREINRLNGLKGGRPINPTKPKKPNGLNQNPTKPKKGVSVSDSVSDSDILNKEILELGDKTQKHFILINSPFANEHKYRLWGVDGVGEFLEMNGSQWPRTDFAEKFLRDKSGQPFNDFGHILNAYNVYIKNQFK